MRVHYEQIMIESFSALASERERERETHLGPPHFSICIKVVPMQVQYGVGDTDESHRDTHECLPIYFYFRKKKGKDSASTWIFHE